MVSEDPETYDIHGDLMGGWPTVVNPVIAVGVEMLYFGMFSHYVPLVGPVVSI
jgi:hypothetical protein